jgi:hypothetical protein
LYQATSPKFFRAEIKKEILMSAIRELIAAALTAADDLDRICKFWQINPCASLIDLREELRACNAALAEGEAG